MHILLRRCRPVSGKIPWHSCKCYWRVGVIENVREGLHKAHEYVPSFALQNSQKSMAIEFASGGCVLRH